MDVIGHINHSLFWKNLAPAADKGGAGGKLVDGPLKDAIDRDFGSFDGASSPLPSLPSFPSLIPSFFLSGEYAIEVGHGLD